MVLKKTEATLDELLTHQETLRAEIKDKQKQEKTLNATIKQFQKFTASVPAERAPRRKKSRAAVASS